MFIKISPEQIRVMRKLAKDGNVLEELVRAYDANAAAAARNRKAIEWLTAHAAETDPSDNPDVDPEPIVREGHHCVWVQTWTRVPNDRPEVEVAEAPSIDPVEDLEVVTEEETP